uniref:Ribosomal RNA-processing protein 40 n=1 Tax=Ascaris lumbricoides TaxID=6252 RepID=A0A0M3IFZ6_ASCLU
MTNICLPGDLIEIDSKQDQEKKVIGRGLQCDSGDLTKIRVVQPGLLKSCGSKRWVAVYSNRYIPQEGDKVLGVVKASRGDLIKVDIGASDIASISFLGFEGATKRNRPVLKTGDLIYAAVILAMRHLEATLTCVDNEGRAQGLGLLPSGGFLFKTSLNLARRLLSPSSRLLSLIGKEIKFEITCGMNGRIWIKASKANEVAAIYRMIVGSQSIPESDIPTFIDEHMRILKGM